MDLPRGSPLETPLHPKKKKIRHYLESMPPVNIAAWSSEAAPRPSSCLVNTAASSPVPPTVSQPESFSITPSSSTNNACSALQIAPSTEREVHCVSNKHPPRVAKRDILLNYGSEEEDNGIDEELDEELPLQLPVPRHIGVFLEPEEDSPQEAAFAGRASSRQVDHSDGNVVGPLSLFDFDWQAFPISPICPHSRRETFVGDYGPTTSPPLSPYEAFVKIWDRPIMEHIALQTNIYAQEYAAHLLERGEIGPNSRITNWKDTNVDELYTYFALLIAMGIVCKSKFEDYWKIDKTIFSTPGFSLNMSSRRFHLLSRCLHFNDNSSFSPALTRSQAKVFKVQPIVDHLNLKFSSLYGLGQNVAVDESLTQWKGWLDIKQFIPNKAATVGIKTYEVCDSRTGYLWRFQLHTGGKVEPEQVLISGSIPNLVLQLLRGLEHRGHTIWMDNYYNSPALARILKTLGFDCAGTLRTNRQFVPEQLTCLKKSDMKSGQVSGYTSGDVDLMVWHNQNRARPIAMISTYHGIAVSGDKPILVQDYNICMGGVDRKDQMLAMYPMERKRTHIWYKKFFRRLLNVSILNAFILHKYHTPHISHREFRTNLVTEILQQHRLRAEVSMSVVRGVPKFTADVISHFPVELQTSQPNPDRNTNSVATATKLRRKCIVCTKRTSFACNACKVSLCFSSKSSCYIEFHTK